MIIGARLVGDLDARPPFIRIFKEVDVGSLVEAVVGRLRRRRAVEVMDVPETAALSH